VPILTADQANRDVLNALKAGHNVGTEHVGYSDRITHPCDLVMFLDQGKEEDRMMNILNLNIVKYRDKSRDRMQLAVDWETNTMRDLVPNDHL
jgi:hypothetical protein